MTVVINGERTLFKNEAQRDNALEMYDRVLSELWPKPFETRFITTRFGKTHVIESGPENGKPVVFLHGGGTSSTMWYNVVGYFMEAGYRCYAIDRVGDVGKSTIKTTPDTAQEQADFVLDAIDALKLDKPPMIGLSYGGFMNINFAKFYPERISHIIMLTPGGIFAKLRTWFTLRATVSVLSGFKPLLRNFANWLAAGPMDRNVFLDLQLATWRLWGGPEFMPPVYSDEELSAIFHPTLLMVGDKDVIYDPVFVLDRAADTMPNVEVELVPGRGHAFTATGTDITSARMLKFLSDHQ